MQPNEYYLYDGHLIEISYDEDEDHRWSYALCFDEGQWDPQTNRPNRGEAGTLLDISPYCHCPNVAAMMLDIGNPSRFERQAVGPMSAEEVKAKWESENPGKTLEVKPV